MVQDRQNRAQTPPIHEPSGSRTDTHGASKPAIGLGLARRAANKNEGFK